MQRDCDRFTGIHRFCAGPKPRRGENSRQEEEVEEDRQKIVERWERILEFLALTEEEVEEG